MRVKSVPRHLPRKDSTQGLSKAKNAATNSMEFLTVKKFETSGSAGVKTVNFTNYQDIVQEMDLATRKQNVVPQKPFEQWRPFKTEIKIEAVDLTVKAGGNVLSPPASPAESNKFKDTYLYQIMTDPNFLQKIMREKQATKSSCPYCKEEFSSESEVKKHLNVQADDANQLSCCACGKSFAQKRYLRYHQRCHSERNKFACDICTRKYSRLDNLTRHNIFHTNPDKFPCNSCERTFARKDLLNKHLKCHENKYKFHCDICQKYFKGPISLENHTKLFHSSQESSSSSAESYPSLSACLSKVGKNN